MKKILLSFVSFFFLASSLFAQLSLSMSGAPVTVNFTGFAGAGFSPTPTAGQLDSDNWAMTGMSDGNLAFGGTNTTGDFARGVTTGGVTSGGIYGFDNGSNQMAWFQPGGSDFTPGTFTLRMQNNTGGTLTQLDIAYTLHVLNDQGRANSFNFSWSTDDVTYFPEATLDYTSVEVATGMTDVVPRAISLTSLAISPGSFIYIRWESDDVSGGGSRDEFGLDDISVTPYTGVVSPTFNFSSATYSVGESGGSVIVPVTLSTSTTCSVEVLLGAAGNAVNGTDFAFSSPQILFFTSGGATSIDLNISIFDNMVVNPNKDFLLYLLNPSSGCQIGAIDTSIITILDDDYNAYDVDQITGIDVDGIADSIGVKVELQGLVYGVNIRGTNGLQFTFNDGTDGIGVFSAVADYGYTVAEGDDVVLRGTVSQFSGLTQVVLDTLILSSSGNSLPAPTVVTALGENTESELVTINNVRIIDPAQWLGNGNSFNVNITNDVDTFQMRIDNDVDLSSMGAPIGYFNLTGLGGQFDGTSPYLEGYQILPRYAADIDVIPVALPQYTIAEVTNVDTAGVADSIGVACILVGVVHGVNLRPTGLQTFIIDATGGINVFLNTGNLGYTVNEGDEIGVRGSIAQFSGLTEIIPDSIWLISTGNPLVTAPAVTVLNETTESELVRINNVRLIDPLQWSGAGSGFSVDITNDVDTFSMRIDNDVDLFSMPFPGGYFDVIGLGSQFDPTSPYFDGYQILPRYEADIIPNEPPVCGKDGYEGNDTKGTAAFIAGGAIGIAGNARICPMGDIDWYRFTTPPNSLNVNIRLDGLPKNYDLELHDGVGMIASSTNTGKTSEQILFSLPTSGSYYVRVFSPTSEWSAGSGYVMSISYLKTNPFTGSVKNNPWTPFFRESNADAGFTLFPNPSDGIVRLRIENGNEYRLSVLDMAGRIVFSGRHDGANGETELDLSSLPDGIYLVRAEDGDLIFQDRIILSGRK